MRDARGFHYLQGFAGTGVQGPERVRICIEGPPPPTDDREAGLAERHVTVSEAVGGYRALVCRGTGETGNLKAVSLIVWGLEGYPKGMPWPVVSQFTGVNLSNPD